MSTPAESSLVAAVRALAAKHGGPVASPVPSANLRAAEQTRAALMARLAVATDNAERWNLAEQINALP